MRHIPARKVDLILFIILLAKTFTRFQGLVLFLCSMNVDNTMVKFRLSLHQDLINEQYRGLPITKYTGRQTLRYNRNLI